MTSLTQLSEPMPGSAVRSIVRNASVLLAATSLTAVVLVALSSVVSNWS